MFKLNLNKVQHDTLHAQLAHVHPVYEKMEYEPDPEHYLLFKTRLTARNYICKVFKITDEQKLNYYLDFPPDTR